MLKYSSILPEVVFINGYSYTFAIELALHDI